MQRISTATKAVDLFGSGKHGFKDRNLGAGIVPTDFDAAWFNGVQEEVLAPIEAVGIVPSAVTRNQLLAAIRSLSGSNVTTVNFAASPAALTALQGGLVIVDATAGNVVINLPLSAALSGLKFEFLRVDNTANTVTVNRAGSNTIDGATSFTLTEQNSGRTIRSDGASVWRTPLNGAGSLATSGWNLLSSGLILQWGFVTFPASGISTSALTVTLPLTLPKGVILASGIIPNRGANSADGRIPADGITGYTASTASFVLDCLGVSTFNQVVNAQYFVIGK